MDLPPGWYDAFLRVQSVRRHVRSILSFNPNDVIECVKYYDLFNDERMRRIFVCKKYFGAERTIVIDELSSLAGEDGRFDSKITQLAHLIDDGNVLRGDYWGRVERQSETNDLSSESFSTLFG